MAIRSVDLTDFTAEQSSDPLKDAFELVHGPCGQVLCDIEPGDSLGTLERVARHHACPDEVPARGSAQA